MGHPENLLREEQAGIVGAISHSAQIDPIHPRSCRQDESAEAGAMTDGPYNGKTVWQAASQANQNSG
ncbi:MAG TPA: hypothetical protein VH593_28110 [Ktedonobacteraceae bacterium]|jgi:hypothetical protein